MADTVPTWAKSDAVPSWAKTAAPKDNGNSLVSQFFQPIKNIPSDIVKEFRSGSQEISGAYKESVDAAKRGERMPTSVPARLVMGGLQEAVSPLSGVYDALAVEPVKAQFPKGSQIGEFAGNLVGDAAAMYGPMALEKSAASMAKFAPKLNQSVKTLMDAGVKLTPGQIFGGLARKAEETARSLPVLTNFISKAQLRSVEDFNKAVINKSLAQVGEKLPAKISAGRKTVAYADKVLSAKYDQVLSKLTFKPDPQFNTDITTIAARNARRLSENQEKQWKSALDYINDHLDPQTGAMDGQSFKKVESELGHIARNYFSSPVPSDREFAQSVNDLRGAFRDTLERSNPQYAKELQNINSAWATFARAQGASIRNVKEGGVFSPADLLRDIKSAASKGAFARGDALLQPLAEAANDILPDNVSALETGKLGFYERGATLGLLGAGEMGYLDKLLSPEVLLPATMTVGAYTRPGIATTNWLVRDFPELAKILSTSPASGVLAAWGLNQANSSQKNQTKQ